MAQFNLAQYKKQSGSIEHLPVPKEPKITSEDTTYTSAVNSAVFDDECNLVRVVCDADAYMECEAAPTATGESTRLIADEVYWFEVSLASSLRMSFYDGVTV